MEQLEAELGGTDAAQRAPPAHRELLVFICDNEQLRDACIHLATRHGHQRVAQLKGGLNSLQEASRQEQTWANIQFISRDALAAILGMTPANLGVPILLIDVRRSDERILYGSIGGSVHLPGASMHACPKPPLSPRSQGCRLAPCLLPLPPDSAHSI